MKWVKAHQHQHHVKLQFKVRAWANFKDLSEFINSIHIIEINLEGIDATLKVRDSFYKSLRSLKIYDNDKI